MDDFHLGVPMKLTLSLFAAAAVVAVLCRRRRPVVRDVEADIQRAFDAAMGAKERSLLAAVAG